MPEGLEYGERPELPEGIENGERPEMPEGVENGGASEPSAVFTVSGKQNAFSGITEIE